MARSKNFRQFTASLTRAFGNGTEASEFIRRLNALTEGEVESGASFGRITVPGQQPVVAASAGATLSLLAGGSLTITTNPTTGALMFSAPSPGLSSAITSITSGANTITASGSTGVTLIAGTNMTSIVVDPGGNTITFNAAGGGGSGDVVGPAGATNGGIAVFDGTTGKLIADSTVTIASISSSISSAAGTAQWGGITGTLSSQTDLQTALNGKASTGAVGSTGITMATARLLGRSTAGTGAIEEIQVGTGLDLTAGVLTASGGGGGGGNLPYNMSADFFRPTKTDGCGDLDQVEFIASVQPNMVYLPFAAGVDTFAEAMIAVMPANWNATNVSFRILWAHPETTTDFDVVWAVKCRQVQPGQLVAGGFGTEVDVTDTGGTANTYYLTDAIAVVPGGTGSVGALSSLYISVSRKGTDGADTMAVEARLLGVFMEWTATP